MAAPVGTFGSRLPRFGALSLVAGSFPTSPSPAAQAKNPRTLATLRWIVADAAPASDMSASQPRSRESVTFPGSTSTAAANSRRSVL